MGTCVSLFQKKAETNRPKGREEDLWWKKKKSGCRRETCHIVRSFSCGASFQGLAITSLSKHYLCVELILALWRRGWEGIGSLQFMWSSTRCDPRKNTSTYASAPRNVIRNTRSKEQNNISCYSATLIKCQEIERHAHTNKTKRPWEWHTHFFKTQPLPFSTSLIPDTLYQAFYLFFIHFHNAFRWCDCYSERRLVNLQPFASILPLVGYWALLFRPHVCIGPHLPALSCGYDIIERKTRAFSPKCTLTH